MMLEAPTHSTSIKNQAKYEKIAPNARKVTGVAFLNLPPIFNALAASRCISRASLNILVSLIMLAPFFFSIQLTQFLFCLIFFKNKAAAMICCQNVMALSRNILTIDTS